MNKINQTKDAERDTERLPNGLPNDLTRDYQDNYRAESRGTFHWHSCELREDNGTGIPDNNRPMFVPRRGFRGSDEITVIQPLAVPNPVIGRDESEP